MYGSRALGGCVKAYAAMGNERIRKHTNNTDDSTVLIQNNALDYLRG